MKESQIFSNIEFTYDSENRKSAALEELRDVTRYRDLLYQLIRRDIVARYKRSILGVVWTMLQPLGMMVVMSIVFSRLFGRLEGYAIYLLSGLVCWNFFSQTTSSALQQIVWGETLMRRIFIPHTTFSISSIGTGIVNIIFSMVPLVLLMVLTLRPVTWAVLFIPISVVLLAAFALGVGLTLSTLAVQFPDIREMYQILLQAWMYLTPIMYPIDILPVEYRYWILYLNPMYYMVSLFRIPIYDGKLPSPDIFVAATSISLLSLVVGWVYFSSQMDTFAYQS